MNTNEEMLTDISAELDKEFGAPGTPERARVCRPNASTADVFGRANLAPTVLSYRILPR